MNVEAQLTQKLGPEEIRDATPHRLLWVNHPAKNHKRMIRWSGVLTDEIAVPAARRRNGNTHAAAASRGLDQVHPEHEFLRSDDIEVIASKKAGNLLSRNLFLRLGRNA